MDTRILVPVLFLVILAVSLAAPPAYAGATDGPVIALHAEWHLCKGCTACPGDEPWRSVDPVTSGIPCSQFVADWGTLEPGWVYIVVAEGDGASGIAGLSCGIRIDPPQGVWAAWNLCADSELPSLGWPANGGGNRMFWDPDTSCQRTVIAPNGVHAAVGAFYCYAYGDGELAVTPNPSASPPEALILDCAGNELEPAGVLPVMGFGTLTGYNPYPCGDAVPVARRSWGRLKATY